MKRKYPKAGCDFGTMCPTSLTKIVDKAEPVISKFEKELEGLAKENNVLIRGHITFWSCK